PRPLLVHLGCHIWTWTHPSLSSAIIITISQYALSEDIYNITMQMFSRAELEYMLCHVSSYHLFESMTIRLRAMQLSNSTKQVIALSQPDDDDDYEFVG